MALRDAFATLAAGLFSLALASAAVQPPTTVRVGDGTLDGSFLVPYNNAWFYSVRFSDGRELPEGVWSDHMQWTVVNGKRAMLRVQGVSFISGASNVIMNVFAPETLAPISSETHNIDGTVFKRTFDGAHVTSVLLANTKDTKAPAVSLLPRAVYDFNGDMFGILMASLPLRQGLRGTLPAVADHDDTLTAEPFEVLRQEDVDAGARGKVRAWLVESARPGDYTMKFWVTKTAPFIIKLVMTDETHGRVLSWDMI